LYNIGALKKWSNARNDQRRGKRRTKKKYPRRSAKKCR